MISSSEGGRFIMRGGGDLSGISAPIYRLPHTLDGDNGATWLPASVVNMLPPDSALPG